ncbi:MAG: DUF480 domain-containing protein [Candidatus Stygibacter frigidus]|nr:DUF480 domain-containing protein [Candidatus Stygibacter frigidus]
MKLTRIEVRILGALVEKEQTTPDYYPLSLNALRNACNQKSNRDPVMNVDEQTLIQTLDELREKKLVIFSTGQGQRVIKYKHNMSDALHLDQREISLLAALFLRGAQTQGELRLHTHRMHEFDSLDEVQQFLQKLNDREIPLVRLLARQPGQKEQRYIHLLDDQEEVLDDIPEIQVEKPESEIEELKAKIEQLQEEITELKLDYYNLKKELGIT